MCGYVHRSNTGFAERSKSLTELQKMKEQVPWLHECLWFLLHAWHIRKKHFRGSPKFNRIIQFFWSKEFISFFYVQGSMLELDWSVKTLCLWMDESEHEFHCRRLVRLLRKMVRDRQWLLRIHRSWWTPFREVPIVWEARIMVIQSWPLLQRMRRASHLMVLRQVPQFPQQPMQIPQYFVWN